MTAYFKGFEKHEETTLAVVDFPDAKKHTPYFQADGSLTTRTQPFPHEERLDETAFKQKFAGLGFDAVRDLSFSEEGHDLTAILNDHLRSQTPGAVPLGPGVKPPGR